MSFFGTTDYWYNVVRGNVAGSQAISIGARNLTVPDSSMEFVNSLGLTDWPLSAPTTVRIASGGNGNDTAAGSGAREVTVEGIDSNLDLVSEAIATAGGSASSATTASFWRVHRASVSVAGTYGEANAGAIVIENSGGGTDLIEIESAFGLSAFGGFSIPQNVTGYLVTGQIQVGGVENKPASFQLLTRANFNDATAPVDSKVVVAYLESIFNVDTVNLRLPIELPALTDFWLVGMGEGSDVPVSGGLGFVLVDD